MATLPNCILLDSAAVQLDEIAVGESNRLHRDLVSRFPGNVLDAKIVEGTADFHHRIANMVGTKRDVLFKDTTALDGTDNVLNPNATL